MGHSWRSVEAQLGLGELGVTSANKEVLLPFSPLNKETNPPSC